MKNKFIGVFLYDLTHIKKFVFCCFLTVAVINVFFVLLCGFFGISGAISALIAVSEWFSRLATLAVTAIVVINLIIKESKKTGLFYLSDITDDEKIIIRLSESFILPFITALICLLFSSAFATFANSSFHAEYVAGAKNVCFCVAGKNFLYYLLPLTTGVISAFVFSMGEAVAAFAKANFAPLPARIFFGLAFCAFMAIALYFCSRGWAYVFGFSAFGNGFNELYPQNALSKAFSFGDHFINGERVYPVTRASYLLFYNLQAPVSTLFLAIGIGVNLGVAKSAYDARRKKPRFNALGAMCICITVIFAVGSIVQGTLLTHSGREVGTVLYEKQIDLFVGENYDFCADVSAYEKYNSHFSAVVYNAIENGVTPSGEKKYLYNKDTVNYVSGYKFHAVEKGEFKVDIYLYRGGFFGGENVFGKILECRINVIERDFSRKLAEEGGNEND